MTPHENFLSEIWSWILLPNRELVAVFPQVWCIFLYCSTETESSLAFLPRPEMFIAHLLTLADVLTSADVLMSADVSNHPAVTPQSPFASFFAFVRKRSQRQGYQI